MNQRIVYRYAPNMDEVAQFALQTLRDRSPVGSGEDAHPGLYRDSHMMFIDGHIVADAKNWQPGQAIEISNPVPYSHKIELGTVKMSVPAHDYEETAPLVRQKFPNVTVDFVFMPVRFGDAQAFMTFSKQLRSASPKEKRDWLVHQPALIINAR